jgi:superfamily II DNA/RNA helicase
VGDKLFRVLVSANYVVVDEIDQLLGMGSVFKLKVNSIASIFLLHRGALLCSLVLENKLF